MGRRNWSPLTIRRFSYGMMVLAAVVAGFAGDRQSAMFMVGALTCAVMAVGIYVRASDMLLDFDYPGIRRRSVLLCIGGLLTALLGCVIASLFVDGPHATALRITGYAAMGGGIAAGLAGLVTILWSYSGTYAAEQIEKRSQEEW